MVSFGIRLNSESEPRTPMPTNGNRPGTGAAQSVGSNNASDGIPTSPKPQASLRDRLPIDAIKVGERIRKDMGDIAALAKSIEDIGLLQPIIVTPDGLLLCGERRLRAAKLLGWTEIPVVIVKGGP
jgi:hypothetical protein